MDVDAFVTAASRRLARLQSAGGQPPGRWTADEEGVLRGFAESFDSVSDPAVRGTARSYLEVPEAARKDLLLTVGMLPSIEADVRLHDLSLTILVTDSRRHAELTEAIARLQPHLSPTITTWRQFLPRMRGPLTEVRNHWIVGDVDWVGSSLGSERETVEAIDALVSNRTSRFLMLHQIGRLALLPDGPPTSDPKDEYFAQRLAKLTRAAGSLNGVGYAHVEREAAAIGKELCANGGDPRMQRVAARVAELGGSVRMLELFWRGICDWQF